MLQLTRRRLLTTAWVVFGISMLLPAFDDHWIDYAPTILLVFVSFAPLFSWDHFIVLPFGIATLTFLITPALIKARQSTGAELVQRLISFGLFGICFEPLALDPHPRGALKATIDRLEIGFYVLVISYVLAFIACMLPSPSGRASTKRGFPVEPV